RPPDARHWRTKRHLPDSPAESRRRGGGDRPGARVRGARLGSPKWLAAAAPPCRRQYAGNGLADSDRTGQPGDSRNLPSYHRLPMKTPCPPTAQPRGMAVVGALLIVLVAAVLVTGLLQRQDIDVRAAHNRYLQAQGEWLLRGGMDWASMVLRFDGRSYNTTHAGQLWSIPVEDTRISSPDT